MASHPVSSSHLWGHLKELLQLCKQDIYILLVYSILVGTLSLTTPIAVQSFVSTIAFGSLLQPIVVLAVFVFSGMVFVGVMRALQFYIVEILQKRLFTYAAHRIAQTLPLLPAPFYRQESLPELVNRFLDVATLQKAVATLLIDGLGIILQTLIGLLILAFYHPFFLAFDGLLIVVISFVVVVLGRRAITTSIEESKSKYQVHAWLEEIAQHPQVFRHEQAQIYAALRTDAYVLQYLKKRHAHYLVLFRQVVGSLIFQAVMSALLLALGGYLVLEKQLTIGQLVAAELIVSTVVYGLTKFSKHLESFYDLMAAVDKLFHVFDLPIAKVESTHLATLADEHAAVVSLEQVSLSLNTTSFKVIDLHVKAKEHYFIHALTGQGKTLLAELLCGQINTFDAGIIRIAGVHLAQYRQSDLAQQVQYFSTPQLFIGSLLENLTFQIAEEKNDNLMPRIFDLCENFSVMQFIRDLPQGFNTFIRYHDNHWPAHIQYRLALVRLFLHSPRCVVLDQPFIELDDELQINLLQTLLKQAIKQGMSVVYLASHTRACHYFKHTYQLKNGQLQSIELKP